MHNLFTCRRDQRCRLGLCGRFHVQLHVRPQEGIKNEILFKIFEVLHCAFLCSTRVSSARGGRVVGVVGVQRKHSRAKNQTAGFFNFLASPGLINSSGPIISTSGVRDNS
jgi:hypothetical protein